MIDNYLLILTVMNVTSADAIQTGQSRARQRYRHQEGDRGQQVVPESVACVTRFQSLERSGHI